MSAYPLVMRRLAAAICLAAGAVVLLPGGTCLALCGYEPPSGELEIYPANGAVDVPSDFKFLALVGGGTGGSATLDGVDLGKGTKVADAWLSWGISGLEAGTQHSVVVTLLNGPCSDGGCQYGPYTFTVGSPAVADPAGPTTVMAALQEGPSTGCEPFCVPYENHGDLDECDVLMEAQGCWAEYPGAQEFLLTLAGLEATHYLVHATYSDSDTNSETPVSGKFLLPASCPAHLFSTAVDGPGRCFHITPMNASGDAGPESVFCLYGDGANGGELTAEKLPLTSDAPDSGCSIGLGRETFGPSWYTLLLVALLGAVALLKRRYRC